MDYTPSSNSSINKVKRLPDRAAYDTETIHKILDANLVAHVGFTDKEDWPVVIPMVFGRIESRLYCHGHVSTRILKRLADINESQRVCITVTSIEGLVLALNPFHNSLNYHSAVLFGEASLVQDSTEKLNALRAITDHAFKSTSSSSPSSPSSRWDDSFPPTSEQLKSTSVIRVDIFTASAKIRTGGVSNDKVELDANLDRFDPFWTGIVPLNYTYGPVETDSRVKVPSYIKSLQEKPANQYS